jgi:hypothetical protein
MLDMGACIGIVCDYNYYEFILEVTVLKAYFLDNLIRICFLLARQVAGFGVHGLGLPAGARRFTQE